MPTTDIERQAKRVLDRLQTCNMKQYLPGALAMAEAFIDEFGRVGKPFKRALNYEIHINWEFRRDAAYQAVRDLLSLVETGVGDISYQRQAELDVVSDLLEQADILIKNKKVHPAAPIVLIGASLEEFLRTWIEDEDLKLGTKKPGIETYSALLRDAEKLEKQDGKNITAWAGLRNHAAHGEFDKVNDMKQASMMLLGVNLFMQQHTRSLMARTG